MSKEQIANELLKIKAVFLRPDQPFTWASGIKSPIYCDNRLIISHPDTREIIEVALSKLIKEKFSAVEAVVGTSTAGIPHAAYVSTILNLPMAYVRGKSKDHGRQNNIEGDLRTGMKVVVIEDLLSTGKSCLECVEILRTQNIEVLGVVSIFTYNMKLCNENFNKVKCVKYSLMDLDTLLEIACKTQKISITEQKQILAFRNDPTNSSWMDNKTKI